MNVYLYFLLNTTVRRTEPKVESRICTKMTYHSGCHLTASRCKKEKTNESPKTGRTRVENKVGKTASCLVFETDKEKAKLPLCPLKVCEIVHYPVTNKKKKDTSVCLLVCLSVSVSVGTG